MHPRVVLGLAAALYLMAVTAIFAGHAGNPHILVLAAQCGLLLPAGIYALRSRSSGADDRFVSSAGPRLTVIIALYLIPAIWLGWYARGTLLPADEAAWFFQARIFSSGHITAEAPPPEISPGKQIFEWNIIDHGRWFTCYPPGWPAVLAIGNLFRVPWLVNPLLGALLLALIWMLGRDLFGARTADIAALLCLLSPYFLFNCAGYLSHTCCAVLVTAAALFLFRGSPAAMLVCIGAASLVRPPTGFAVGLVLVAAGFWKSRQRLQFLGTTAAAGALTLLAMALYDRATTGHYEVLPYTLFTQLYGYRQYSFAAHDLMDGVFNRLRWSLQATAVFVVPLLAILIAYQVKADREHRSTTVILLLLLLAVAGVFLIVPLPSGSSWGERYFFEVFGGMAVLAARGWVLLLERWPLSPQLVRFAAITLGCVQAVQFAVLGSQVLAIDYPSRVMRDAARNLSFQNTVVYLDGGFTARHFNLNSPDWKRAPIFYLVDPGPARRDAVAIALERPFWTVMSYDSAAGAARIARRVTVNARP